MKRLFPNLLGRWAYVNLDAQFCAWSRSSMPSLGDAEWMAQMVSDLHDERGIQYSYGGYLEHRGNLLAHTYLAKDKKYLHLGVDFNVPAGSAVASPQAAWVVAVDSDHPEPHGWGPRVILKVRNVAGFAEWVYLVYAHLEAASIRVKPGEILVPGSPFACVGEPPGNGGWFPHLHVQALTSRVFGEGIAQHVDGYGLPADVEQLARDFPDPLPLLL